MEISVRDLHNYVIKISDNGGFNSVVDLVKKNSDK